jgi:hypothetical protein
MGGAASSERLARGVERFVPTLVPFAAFARVTRVSDRIILDFGCQNFTFCDLCVLCGEWNSPAS